MKPSSLANILSLKTLSQLKYQSVENSENFSKTIFGGQVLGQALLAAYNTIENRPVHSLHAYFLRAGSIDSPVDYEVEILRDGKSVSSRRVLALQNGRTIFHLSASFHQPEEGFNHHKPMGDSIPFPEEILSSKLQQYSETKSPEKALRDRSGVEILDAGEGRFDSNEIQAPHHAHWFRIKDPLPSSDLIHQAALAYISDMRLIATSLLPHPAALFSEDYQVASVDHSLWFHSDKFSVNDWMLYEMESPWAGHGRGFSNARIYNKNGELIASVAQEGVIRKRK